MDFTSMTKTSELDLSNLKSRNRENYSQNLQRKLKKAVPNQSLVWTLRPQQNHNILLEGATFQVVTPLT